MKKFLLFVVIIKAILVSLFVGGIGTNPYFYYQIMKIIALTGFGILAFTYNARKSGLEMIGATIGVIIFNPFFKLHFPKPIWQEIDIILAILLGVWCLIDLLRMDLIDRV